MRKVQVEIKLYSGGSIGTIAVIDDLAISSLLRNKDKQSVDEYITKIVEDQIRKSIDHLIIEGAIAISNKK